VKINSIDLEPMRWRSLALDFNCDPLRYRYQQALHDRRELIAEVERLRAWIAKQSCEDQIPSCNTDYYPCIGCGQCKPCGECEPCLARAALEVTP
jgi:hypothetical protein